MILQVVVAHLSSCWPWGSLAIPGLRGRPGPWNIGNDTASSPQIFGGLTPTYPTNIARNYPTYPTIIPPPLRYFLWFPQYFHSKASWFACQRELETLIGTGPPKWFSARKNQIWLSMFILVNIQVSRWLTGFFFHFVTTLCHPWGTSLDFSPQRHNILRSQDGPSRSIVADCLNHPDFFERFPEMVHLCAF